MREHECGHGFSLDTSHFISSIQSYRRKFRRLGIGLAATALAVIVAASPSQVAAGKWQKFPADLTDKAANLKCVAPDRDTPGVPQLLSETGCVLSTDPTTMKAAVIPYSVNTPLWSDGATTRQWAAFPEGETIKVSADGTFDLPIGTVLINEFGFEDQRHETRLLMRHPDGAWAGYSYKWLADQSDAELLPDGAMTETLSNGIEWTYPSRAACFDCPTEAPSISLGLNVHQLNRVKWHSTALHPDLGHQINQLMAWQAMGLFDPAQGLENVEGLVPAAITANKKNNKKNKEPVVGAADLPALARSLDDVWVHVARRARSYLHSNCSGCHKPGGSAPVALDLRFSTPMSETGLCNGIPIDDLGDPDNKLLAPGKPWRSIVYLRMKTRGEDQMPPVGTTVVDDAAKLAVQQWIEDPSVCDEFADSDGDGVTDEVDNCLLIANAAQEDFDLDGFGNLCDGDLNNNGMTGDKDDKKHVKALLTEFKADGYWPAGRRLDFDGDGFVTKDDQKLIKSVMKQLKNQPPGPSCCE